VHIVHRFATPAALERWGDDPRHREYWTEYHRMMERRGVSVQVAKLEMRRRLTLIGAMMIHKGEADGMLCGMIGTHAAHLFFIDQVLGRRSGVGHYYAMNVLVLPRRTVFLCDTYVNVDPDPKQICEMTALAAEEVRRFGLTPKVALVSHSNFGSSDGHACFTASAASVARATSTSATLTSFSGPSRTRVPPLA